MRCRYCGSTSLRNDTEHKTFSTGKAVAGTVTFGYIGAVAGFIGKDKKGYRCNVCGGFMETPMDSVTEFQINSAIRDAESGRSTALYNYYKGQYINIQANIPFKEAGYSNPAPLPTPSIIGSQQIDFNEAEETEQIKNQYSVGVYYPGSPVFIERIKVVSENNEDAFSMRIYNISSNTLRSLYFNAKVFDDTGDQISEGQFLYQGLNVLPGELLPEDKTFALHTESSFKIEVILNKAAFENNDVWRNEKGTVGITLPEQPVLNENNFARMKYVRTKWTDIKQGDDPVKMPMQLESCWLCDCGLPVSNGENCPRCKDKWENLEKAFSQKHLIQAEQNVVKARAAERTEALQKRYSEAQKNGSKREAEYKDGLYTRAQAAITKGTIEDY